MSEQTPNTSFSLRGLEFYGFVAESSPELFDGSQGSSIELGSDSVGQKAFLAEWLRSGDNLEPSTSSMSFEMMKSAPLMAIGTFVGGLGGAIGASLTVKAGVAASAMMTAALPITTALAGAGALYMGYKSAKEWIEDDSHNKRMAVASKDAREVVREIANDMGISPDLFMKESMKLDEEGVTRLAEAVNNGSGILAAKEFSNNPNSSFADDVKRLKDEMQSDVTPPAPQSGHENTQISAPGVLASITNFRQAQSPEAKPATPTPFDDQMKPELRRE